MSVRDEGLAFADAKALGRPSSAVRRLSSDARIARRHTCDVLVVGGGPAGAAAACKLSEAGREVLLVEREAAPAETKVCGEFLSREAGLYLSALGLVPSALGAVPIDTVRFSRGERSYTSPLPFAATSLSRKKLDEAILARAAAAGALVLRGAKVVALGSEGNGFSARLGDESIIFAKHVFLATGKHDLRGYRRPRGLHAGLVAFKLHFRLAAAQAERLARRVELLFFDGGYAGVQPVEAGRVNLCMLVRRSYFAASGARFSFLLSAMRAASPSLDALLADATPCSPRPLSLSAIPFGYVRHKKSPLWLLGDQAVVMPSFTGDGISIALHSAELAATAFLQGRSPEEYQRALARDMQRPVLVATLLSHALVRPEGQVALDAVARLWPHGITAAARYTRVPEAALLRAGLVPTLR